MKVLQIGMIAFFVTLGICCQSGGMKESADLVLLNGAVWTVNPDQPWVKAVAVKDERILEVGSVREIKALIGEHTQVIDLSGAMVLPGFIDSHTHFFDGGFALSSIQLKDVGSRVQFVSTLEKKAGELEKGEWILNGDWDNEKFDPPDLPRKEWIDSVSPDNPVCVNRYDGHMVLVNSRALALAGITKKTASPPGGEVQKDPKTGEPTGILTDAAIDLVTRHIPEPSLEDKIEAVETALAHARKLGVTSITDMGTPDAFEVYQELLKAGRLTARLYVFIPISNVDLLVRLKMKSPFGNNLLRLAGLKGFVDGSLGSSTALFFDPYTDNPSKKGLLVSDMFPEGIMEERLLEADSSGLQVAVHAIGDRANHIILDLFEKVMNAHGSRDRRWRVEHAQHLNPEIIQRFGALNVIASMQPYHAIDDGRWAERKIGHKRAQSTYAFRSLLDAGARLAFGSDWTVAPLDPLSGIYAAVTRQTLDGRNPGGWIPEQKISLEEAIKGYTLEAAYAEFSEDMKGSIENGKLADLVVLDKNLFDISQENIKDAKVLFTIFNGKVIYQK